MSNIEQKNKWLPGVRRLPSQNYDIRPVASEIELIVLHAISLPPEEFGCEYIEQFFTNSLDWEADKYFRSLKGMKVSPHLLIDRRGEVTQFVGLDKRAWHAGDSVWKGKKDCNDFSIGIELEGCDRMPFEEEQYLSLANLLTKIFALYPLLNIDSIVGHSDVSPGRKTDPGPFFDWALLKEEIASLRS